jgi:predicted amidohydrolase
MSDRLTLAVAQPLCRAAQVEANVEVQAALIRSAAARVVVFPELSLTGYELDAPAITVDDPRLAPLVEACAETGAVALVGAPLRDPAGPEYIAVLAVDRAEVTVAYRKTHLDSTESRFTAGEPAVLTVDGWRLGLAVCKDTGIVRHAADTAALGMDVYLAGTLMHREETEIQIARARRIATDHGVHVGFASYAGATGGGFTDPAGRSAIWGPNAEVLAEAGSTPGELARATLRR